MSNHIGDETSKNHVIINDINNSQI